MIRPFKKFILSLFLLMLKTLLYFFGIWYLVQGKVPNRPFGGLELNFPQ